MKQENPEQPKPRIRIMWPDPIYGGRYSVRCECGRVWDAWVDALPYIDCPGCSCRVEAEVMRKQKREERWS